MNIFVEIILITILTAIGAISMSAAARHKADHKIVDNNKIIMSKIMKIDTAINNYCLDSTYSGQPTFDDLNSSNYLPNFDNDNGYGNPFTIDFSGYDNKAYTITQKIEYPKAIINFSKDIYFRAFGTKPSCDLDPNSSDYGTCSLVIPLQKECL